MRSSALLAISLLLPTQPLYAASATTDVAAPTPDAVCPVSRTAGGHDYHGLAVTRCNFSGQDLVNADFSGTQLTAVNFIKANLTGANFSKATILDSRNPALSTDFSFANLTNAKFVGVVFDGTTYLTYARLTCADFSHTALDTGNAIFGDTQLDFEPQESCRIKFQNAVMSCEFIAQWNQFDLTNADISACDADLDPGHDFSGAQMAGVSFSGLDLSGTKWTGATLEGVNFQGATLDNATGLNGTTALPAKLSGATFNKASVRNVDFSNAELYGADFTEADLTGSSFAGAFLTSNPPKTLASGRFTRAHLKNVDLSGAHLRSVDFGYASLYGSFGGSTPSFPCRTDTSLCPTSKTGFTCACASAAGADLTLTNFSNAFLFGVDFASSTTTVNGTIFSSAILVGAKFDSAGFAINGGAPPDFSNALLQGANLGAQSKLVSALLTGAFVDFGAQSNTYQGNILYLSLPDNYTRFRNWPGAAAPCVQTPYPSFTMAPANESMTCPNGSKTVCGTGSPAPQANPNWANGTPLVSNQPVKGSYLADATYDKGSSSALCWNGAKVDSNW